MKLKVYLNYTPFRGKGAKKSIDESKYSEIW